MQKGKIQTNILCLDTMNKNSRGSGSNFNPLPIPPFTQFPSTLNRCSSGMFKGSPGYESIGPPCVRLSENLTNAILVSSSMNFVHSPSRDRVRCFYSVCSFLPLKRGDLFSEHPSRTFLTPLSVC